jgi:hypothetical protein
MPPSAITAACASWPLTLRRVRVWLDPWLFLARCWRAWSSRPPPPDLQALRTGRPLDLHLRAQQRTAHRGLGSRSLSRTCPKRAAFPTAAAAQIEAFIATPTPS